ncbi:hypothetical protein BU23DRAFT_34558 [Bimuria novae-zelandiae CBS 107.79]|uniref:Zinc finger PHD-type domain-containing protein n=1 Tax=Bimuria novae-zelandiae CBS 107.79 TaxID=1447943 RepID=A0A6A5UKB3_9PLEO|nr:hypothetical protein BU23DRAFT_34558 [Bimuria novae-zelandiae CBS 107.79]
MLRPGVFAPSPSPAATSARKANDLPDIPSIHAIDMSDESATDNVWAGNDHPPPGMTTVSHRSRERSEVVEHNANPTEQDAPAVIAGLGEKMQALRSNVCKESASLAAQWRVIAAKTYLARYPLSVVFAWICWLFLAVLLVDSIIIGTRSISMPHYRIIAEEIANSNFHEATDFKRGELLEMRLSKRLFETHLQCLARAITAADDHYGDLPYQSVKEIIDDTVWWAQDECNRLTFTPEVPPTGWYRVWRTLTNTAEVILHRCKDAVGALFKANKRSIPEQDAVGLLSLPLGFRIECSGNSFSICRLFSTVRPSTDAINRLSKQGNFLKQRYLNLRRLVRGLTRIHALGDKARRSIPLMTLLGITTGTIAAWDAILNDNTIGWKICRNSVMCLGAAVLILLAYFRHQRLADNDYFSTSITTTSLIIHVVVVILSVVSVIAQWFSYPYILPRLSEALHDIRRIYFGTSDQGPNEVEAGQHNEPDTDTDESTDKELNGEPNDERVFNESGDHVELACKPASETLKPSSIGINPESPFYQDVQRMREHLHKEQATSKLGPQPFHLKDTSFGGNQDKGVSKSPDGDSGWTIIPQAGSESVGSARLDASHHDEKVIDELTEALTEGEEGESVEGSTKDISKDKTSKSYTGTVKCSVCGIDGLEVSLLPCNNADCPLQWTHLKCAGVVLGAGKPVNQQHLAIWSCPMCGNTVEHAD